MPFLRSMGFKRASCHYQAANIGTNLAQTNVVTLVHKNLIFTCSKNKIT